MKKVLHIALLVSFVLTIMVPLTGIHLHKLASVLFLVLTLIHTFAYHKKMGVKKYLLLAVILLSFVSGILGMIFDQYPVVLQLHRALSIAVVFFAAVHIFVYHKKLR